MQLYGDGQLNNDSFQFIYMQDAQEIFAHGSTFWANNLKRFTQDVMWLINLGPQENVVMTDDLMHTHNLLNGTIVYICK